MRVLRVFVLGIRKLCLAVVEDISPLGASVDAVHGGGCLVCVSGEGLTVAVEVVDVDEFGKGIHRETRCDALAAQSIKERPITALHIQP